MRSTVLRALFVCSVPNTRRPVSAAVKASEIVSRSRISPTSTMSVSWRSEAFSPAANEIESVGTSRCVMMLRLLSCTNSIGSSIVITCLEKFSLMKSISAACVVVLPEPVGTGDEHESAAQVGKVLHDYGNAQLFECRIFVGISRNAAAYPSDCLK